jgi:subtilisin family serine protease
MLTFAAAVEKVEATGAPVVEGFAVKLTAEAEAAAVTAFLDVRLPNHAWTAEEMPEGWWMIRSGSDAEPAPEPPSLGAAWDVIRELKNRPSVERAEPLLVTRSLVTNGSDAQRSFQLWGRVSDERAAEIQRASKPLHWSLVQMGVCDANGNGGAWGLWKAKPGNANKTPGEGIVVAHPDTGYTKHARLLPHLLPQAGNPARFGRNFVERGEPDALDPMTDRSFAQNPGHGTSTASVIATGNAPGTEPWGVAPGAKILPLRVSSSVIHLSFQNVCDAFVEAMNQGAHVISMSLGGPVGSELLNTLIRRALDRGIIVVSAAGNNAPTVVFPALVPGVIGCAASNAVKAPWRLSGLGAAVAVTAPGELVWHDSTRIDGNGTPQDDRINTSGTSYATATVAGLAALWLSFHGRDNLIQNHCGNKPGLLPFLFRLCLQRSSDNKPSFIREGRGGFGAGIVQADKLLAEPLPSAVEAEENRKKIFAQEPDGIVSFPLSSLRIILTLPTFTETGPFLVGTEEERQQRLEGFLAGDDGVVLGSLDDEDRAEIGVLASMDVGLSNALARIAQAGRSTASPAAVRRYLLRRPGLLSKSLGDKLRAAQSAAQEDWRRQHPELALAPARPSPGEAERGSQYAAPRKRRLRAYAFDPSLSTQSRGAAINEITIPVAFERDLKPGPVGDYLEVVDVDPASDCAYAPVDLNHPYLLAQDGLPRSEGNPQFHQQMVYAVAMKTITHFEEALGRPIFWSPLRPWDGRSGDDERAVKVILKDGTVDDSDQYVQRLRLYPHALREQNAYYSPQKRAILFGYFLAGEGDPGAEYPGGVVFTCLAHDIVAHEMTHAILDGMHVRFTEPTNPDVFAFHEAFADIVALLQRFTYTELLRDQIGKVRGRFDAGTLMSRLGLQFGQATGRYQALRDALGYFVAQRRKKSPAEWRDRREEREEEAGGEPRAALADAARDLDDEERRRKWQRYQADPSLLARIEEPHERGSLLVAAVFDAYLTIYEKRVADLKRIATGGTGVLPEGDLHPDLVNRMAREATKSANHVLKMCIRAMDYVPPTDITFGEFLRALITADSDLEPNDDRRYRVAFIEAFRRWGIYPRDVRTLSEETLRWSPPDVTEIDLFPGKEMNQVRRALLDWQPGAPRAHIFEKIKKAQARLQKYLRDELPEETKRKVLEGIDTRRSFQVTNLRPARRMGQRGEFLTEMVIEVLQRKDALPYDPEERKQEAERRRAAKQEREERGELVEQDLIPFRGGVTLVVSMERDRYIVRYAIYKRVDSAAREARQREFLLRAGHGGGTGAAEYSSEGLPKGWFSDEEQREKWFKERTDHREAMRASSCSCRRTRMEDKKDADNAARMAGIPVSSVLTEPFALLHRG